MSRKDFFHKNLKTALEKDGWDVTHDPLSLRFKNIDLFIDLGAEKILAAEKEGEKIAVEIKSFLGPSFISEFHAALGQYINYKMVLEEQEPNRKLYLAVSQEVYDEFFQLPFGRFAVEKNHLKLIIFNPEKEEVTQWEK